MHVYTDEFKRTGFPGGLNWFRCQTGGIGRSELELFSGRNIDVPSCFLSGGADWGIYPKPGALEAMRTKACTRMESFHLKADAGHSVQQEKPEEVSKLLLRFLGRVDSKPAGSTG